MSVIALDEFWEEGGGVENPDLTDELIRAAESKLNVVLPDAFLKLLKIQNGGITRDFGFPMKLRTSWADDHVPFEDMHGIGPIEEEYAGWSILDSEYLSREWHLPPKQVLLTGDGHWWITLDYRNGPNPTVRWIDTEEEDEVHIADSFEEFFKGLVPSSNFL